MNEQKLAGMLGLAVRARQAVLGMDACRLMVQSGMCGVMLLEEETGASTREKSEELCRRTGTPLRIIPDGFIERATGRANRTAALRKGSMADQIVTLWDD